MRASAAGLAWGDDLTRLRRETARHAIVTHADPMAVASGIAQAYAVARLARTPAGTLDPAALIAEIVAVLDGVADTGKRQRRTDAGPEKVRLVDRIAELTDMLDLDPARSVRPHPQRGVRARITPRCAVGLPVTTRSSPKKRSS